MVSNATGGGACIALYVRARGCCVADMKGNVGATRGDRSAGLEGGAASALIED